MARVEERTNTRSAPAWAGDFGGREHIVPFPAKVDAAQFTDGLGVLVKLSAAAAADATSITVDALSGEVPKGTLLHFGESKEFARTTAVAAKGATTIAVEALPAGLEDNDEAVYSRYGRKTIVSGTPVGRTLAERDANTAFGPAIDSDDEIYLLYHDIPDANTNNDAELYRHTGLVKENYLPNYANIAGALLTKLRAAYQCIKGVD